MTTLCAVKIPGQTKREVPLMSNRSGDKLQKVHENGHNVGVILLLKSPVLTKKY